MTVLTLRARFHFLRKMWSKQGEMSNRVSLLSLYSLYGKNHQSTSLGYLNQFMCNDLMWGGLISFSGIYFHLEKLIFLNDAAFMLLLGNLIYVFLSKF